MNSLKIKTGDNVVVTAGKHKGVSAKVVKTSPAKGLVFLENIGLVKRHVKPTQLNPRGGSKEVHRGIDVSNVKLAKASAKTAKSTKKGGK
ncbi:MAG TPA: 50S ribosomal protein L24 [Candidatus Saccharimonadales bacterium]|nr:50S ribosomal protein L24 [Candidatus Saccharimonadales bacterium]